MIPQRLTCPSVWYKRLLLSRSHVEESYSHGLRRWAGYQRFLLQTDEGRSAEPFRRMLEVMISDAEERADVIDVTLQALGDTEDGVVRRISRYDSLYYKPRRDRLLKKVSERRKNRRHRKSSASKGDSSGDKATDDLREAWMRLLQERTRFLAESLTEFAALLNEKTDEDRYEQLFDDCALEAAREELQPLWEEDFNSHLHPSPATEDSQCVCDVDPQADSKTVAPTKSLRKVLPLLSYDTEEKDVYEPRIDAHHRKWRTTNSNPPILHQRTRQPAPINTFSVLPIIKRFGVRWSDMGSSSATTTQRSRLDLVRKYISRGDPHKQRSESRKVEDPAGSTTESTSTETRLGGTDEELNDAKSGTPPRKSTEPDFTDQPVKSVKEGSILPDVYAGKPGFVSTCGKVETLSFRGCPKARKLMSEVRLPTLAPATHSVATNSAMLSPLAQRSSRLTSKLKTLPVHEPRPFSNGGRRGQKHRHKATASKRNSP